MQRRLPHWPLGALALAGALSLAGAASRNVAPDAVTRATTWNEHQGQVAWLTDGLVPPDGAAAPFVWPSKGLVALEWPQALDLVQVRVRVGTADSDFEVRSYLGGRLLEDGAARDPHGERTATVADDSGVADAWIVFDMPAGTRADNLELKTQGTTQIYEIEVLAEVGGTAVEAASWAQVKQVGARPEVAR